MNKQTILVFIASLFFIDGNSQDTASIVGRLKIIKATEAQTIDAEKNVQAFLKDSSKAMLMFDKFFFIGPNLWNKIKSLPEFNKIKDGNMIFKVPKFESDGGWKKTIEVMGKALQNIEDYKHFWNYLQTIYDIRNASIVEKNNRDKFIYWLYYAKLEEPVTAALSSKGRFIIQLMDNRLLFIELTSE